MYEIIKVSKNNPDQSILDKTSSILNSGQVVVLPTDTVYGLCIQAKTNNALEKLSVIKGRSPDKGVPLIIGDIQQLFNFTNQISLKKIEFLKKIWPSPITFIFEAKDSWGFIKNGIAIRFPEQELCRKIAIQAGPFLATSSNRTGEPILDNINEIVLQLQNVRLFLDGGRIKQNIASTIVSLKKDVPELIRDGKIPFKNIMHTWEKI